ncbi:NAD(P)-dependent dehydrogenase (short-subunit alcohol dehydrogenase family) [Arthrobacter stackebrandtii]|uniref:NAD(P)-dependent dehydrogenase (Short-subunit alcohol dehydrogenase family) n=1 Tax=Arthrobacter stackebrandtii TaxID=272161 RepID=A0ABS4YVY0_9MICC|nr:SDR family oxidoreductase [Arthrobacter stackebrandtii]MBP2412976.1 NAD(P)-dependent dehydrogenase (short-subunit alcohol dehydrogenase family) [Arthrobacter stackebrandtii]PYH01236.1 short-chain dehydrogenase [Arthrobacter stackebrandtii]
MTATASNRTYIITGAGSGIGQATAELLRERGATVIGVDLKGADVQGDLSTREGRIAAADAALAAAGGSVDAAIACAGISAPIPLTASVNFFGVTEFLDRLAPALANSASPRAAVVSSMASLQPNSPEQVDAMLAGDEARAVEIGAALAAQGPEVGYLNYPSSKRALSRWVRRASITPQYAGAGIPLNAVAPGTVVTAMTAGLLATPEGREMVDSSVPMPLNGHSDAVVIARLLAWLTSEENTHTTGQTIYTDGGADASLRGDDIWS